MAMEKSYRNILNEYYQKKHLPMPSFNTISVNTDNIKVMQWQCSVKIEDHVIESSIHRTKKAAEAEAARLACQFIEQIRQPLPKFSSLTIGSVKHRVYIDLDNQQNCVKKLLGMEQISSVQFIGVQARYSSVPHIEDWQWIKKIECNSIRNGVDALILMRIGRDIVKGKYEKLSIVTLDNFADAAVATYGTVCKHTVTLRNFKSLQDFLASL